MLKKYKIFILLLGVLFIAFLLFNKFYSKERKEAIPSVSQIATKNIEPIKIV